MKTEREAMQDSTMIAVLILLGFAISTLLLSGCGEIYAGVRRTDKVVQTQEMHDKPLKCLFVSCGGDNGK